MSDIAELIFDSNSTLFEVLDSLSITNLATKITSLQETISLTQDQTRQLGVLIDENQVFNNTSFANVNTRIVDQGVKINSLDEITRNLITSYNDIVIQLNSIKIDVRDLTVSIDKIPVLEQTVTTLNTRVTNLTSKLDLESLRISDLRIELNSQATVIGSNIARISNLENRLNNISFSDITSSLAYLQPNQVYVVVNQVKSNYYTRQLTLNPQGDKSFTMGMPLSGIFGGVSQAFIIFLDDVIDPVSGTYPKQSGMIPIGGPIVMLYGATPSTSTRANVRITKQFLR